MRDVVGDVETAPARIIEPAALAETNGGEPVHGVGRATAARRLKTGLRRSLLPIVLVVASATVAFTAGVVLTYRGAAPASAAFDLAWSVLHPVRLWQQGLAQTGAAADPAAVAAMNENQFVARRMVAGLTGTVLLALRGQSPAYTPRVVEVDRDGHVVWETRLENAASLSDVRKLPNGNVMALDMTCLPAECTANEFGTLFEIDRAGNVVREQRVPATHHAELLPNGNLLLADSNHDLVSELDPTGRTVWSWSARDQIRQYDQRTFVGFRPSNADARNLGNMYADYREGMPVPGSGYAFPYAGADWTHVNSAQRLPNGNTLLSLRNFDLVVEVDARGQVVWSYGPLVLKHQHCAWALGNGNLLISDNGNARVIEVDRASQRIVWQYAEGLRFPVQGCAYRLPSQNTLITDSANLRVIEVTPDQQLAWELKVLTPGTSPLYRAWWSPE